MADCEGLHGTRSSNHWLALLREVVSCISTKYTISARILILCADCIHHTVNHKFNSASFYRPIMTRWLSG